MAALRKVADETRCTTRILSLAGACASKEPRGLEIAFYWSMELVREAWNADTAWVRPDEAIAEIERLPERRLVRAPGRGDRSGASRTLCHMVTRSS
jgi:hypothetical protein